jgi:hypothetical protein
MSRSLLLLCVFGAAASILASCGTKSEALYSVSARSKDLPFDMTVSELRRTPTKSYLKIPGFNDRTAPQARWCMCVFADLARARGFKYWIAVYPPEEPGQDKLILGFSNEANASPAELLGTDFVSERMVGKNMASVAMFQQFCKSAGYL